MSANAESGLDPDKRHRHDVGAVDHGPERNHSATVTLQVMLGLLILATVALVVFTAAKLLG